jgi:hypothetical protein
MTSKHVEFIVKLRDSALMLAEAADEFLKAMAPPELGLETQPTAVIETTFVILKWEAQKGSQLGDFDVAYKANNIQDKWQHPYSILRASNATIQDRYHGKDYTYSYWIYGQDKIYRQKIKPKPTS